MISIKELFLPIILATGMINMTSQAEVSIQDTLGILCLTGIPSFWGIKSKMPKHGVATGILLATTYAGRNFKKFDGPENCPALLTTMAAGCVGGNFAGRVFVKHQEEKTAADAADAAQEKPTSLFPIPADSNS